jgi:predicted DNA-binding protein
MTAGTQSVRAAFSLPAEAVAALDLLARRSGKSKSAIVAELIDERCRRAAEQEDVTRSIDSVYQSMSAEEREEERAWFHHTASALSQLIEDSDSGWAPGSDRAG